MYLLKPTRILCQKDDNISQSNLLSTSAFLQYQNDNDFINDMPIKLNAMTKRNHPDRTKQSTDEYDVTRYHRQKRHFEPSENNRSVSPSFTNFNDIEEDQEKSSQNYHIHKTRAERHRYEQINNSRNFTSALGHQKPISKTPQPCKKDTSDFYSIISYGYAQHPDDKNLTEKIGNTTPME